MFPGTGSRAAPAGGRVSYPGRSGTRCGRSALYGRGGSPCPAGTAEKGTGSRGSDRLYRAFLPERRPGRAAFRPAEFPQGTLRFRVVVAAFRADVSSDGESAGNFLPEHVLVRQHVPARPAEPPSIFEAPVPWIINRPVQHTTVGCPVPAYKCFGIQQDFSRCRVPGPGPVPVPGATRLCQSMQDRTVFLIFTRIYKKK